MQTPFLKPSFFIGGAKHYASNPCPESSSGAHRARLQRNIQGALIQMLPSEEFRGSSESLHFGMSGEVVQSFAEVVSTGNDLVARDDHRSNGDFVLFKRVCLSQGGAGTDRGFFTRVLPT